MPQVSSAAYVVKSCLDGLSVLVILYGFVHFVVISAFCRLISGEYNSDASISWPTQFIVLAKYAFSCLHDIS